MGKNTRNGTVIWDNLTKDKERLNTRGKGGRANRKKEENTAETNHERPDKGRKQNTKPKRHSLPK